MKYSVYYSLLVNGAKFGFYCLSSKTKNVDESLKEVFIGYASTKEQASKMIKENGCINYSY